MSGDFNDLRTSLKQSAYDFRPSLDASALAETGRARSRRRMIIGGVAGTLAVAVAAAIVAPALLGPRGTVPAAPAPPSHRPSESAPTFDPTRPGEDGTDNGVQQFDSMGMPVAGAVVPDGSWKTLAMATANLRVSYPPNWTMNESHWGEIWITAPSGYTINLLTNTLASSCDDGPAATERQIARTDIVATTALGKGPVVIRWRDGGESAASVNLAQHSATEPCWQKFLNYGGVDDAYLGSADNSANPTVNELDQAVAILASASRLH